MGSPQKSWTIMKQTAQLITMSKQELDRLTIITRVLENRLSQVEASQAAGYYCPTNPLFD